MPAAAGTQDVQDTVEQAAGVASRSANVRLCWWEVFLDNIPQIVVDFPEGHDLKFYLRSLIILGQPRHPPDTLYDRLPPEHDTKIRCRKNLADIKRNLLNILKNALPVLHRLFERKVLLHKPPPVLCDPLQVRRVQRPGHILRDALRRVILHNKSGLTVYYNIRYCPDRGREHRGPAGHGLEHDVREPFGVGGEDEEAELVQVCGEVVVGNPAREIDAGGEVFFLQRGLD